MLIQLLIWAARAATKKSGAPAIKRSTKGTSRVGDVTLECPFCRNLGVVAHQRLEEYTGAGWVASETYVCPKCQRSMNAEAMENDGGVLIAREWQCPACPNRNLAVWQACARCGQKV